MMELDDRVRVLEQLGSGQLAARDLAGLNARDLAALAQLAGVAYRSKKFEQAARIFAGLEHLEPEVCSHTLHRAHAEAEAGRSGDAIESVTRYLDREESRPHGELVQALLLRAMLQAALDPEAAEHDVAAAHHLAGVSLAARTAMNGAGR